MGSDLEAHKATCEKALKKCETCELDYNISQEHDCFSALMEAVKIEKEKEKKLRKSLGIDYETLNFKCKKCFLNLQRFSKLDSIHMVDNKVDCPDDCPFKMKDLG